MVGKKTVLSVLFVLVAYFYGRRSGGGKIEGREIETSVGRIKGIISLSRDGKEFYEWLGVQYGIAERFEAPKPIKKWEGVKDASEFGPVCAQLEMLTTKFKGEEDCLFLNVHTPKDIEDGKRLPVLVWIHGGYYMTGSSNLYRPFYFMDEQNVVLVTINYRLGALGFLSTGDEVVRGNMGLKDQALALKWVKQNIAKFGGDDKKITIFGESAGGASAHLHMLSPMSRGLITKVISQSGTALSPWTIYEDPKGQAQNFAKKFNCPTDDSQKMVECLRKIDLVEFVEAHRAGLSLFRQRINIFVPTVEKIIDSETFLPEDPLKLMKEGKFSKLPLLTGFLSAEGLLSSHHFMKNSSFRSNVQEDFDSFLGSFVLLTPDQRSKHSQAIREFYFGSTTHQLDNLESFGQVTNMIGDRLWVHSGIQAAKLQSTYSSVYLYYYDKPGPSLFNVLVAIENKLPIMLEIIISKVKAWVNQKLLGQPAPFYGSCHADELAMLFHMPNLFEIGRHDQNVQFSKEMIRLWIQFAEDHEKLEFRNEKFSKLNAEDLKYFELSEKPGFRHVSKRILDAVQFWSELLGN